jgi:hypothetical protein
MIMTAETLLNDAKIFPSRSGLSSGESLPDHSLYPIDQRPVFPGILLKRETSWIQMFGYLPLPYDFTVFDLFDSVGVDVTIWRFLTLSSGQY